MLISASWSTQAQVTRAVAGGPPGGAIEAIVFDPKDPAVIYGATDWSGVFKTTDRGENWTAINTGLTKTAVYLSRSTRSAQPLFYAGTASGVFKTVNAGESWVSSSSGLPTRIAATIITMLVIDPADSQTIYAGSYDRIFKSIDGAKNWIAIASHPRITQTSSFAALTVDPSPQPPSMQLLRKAGY